MSNAPTADTSPTRDQARAWLERWDRQQEQYIADREERFAVIADVVATRGKEPTVVDLGAGPGSLSVRLLERLPGARVMAVDADGFLLGLSRAAYADLPGLTFLHDDLRSPGWLDALAGLGVGEGTVDAVVSTTALHWLSREELAEVYRAVAGLLRPGGVLVNGDHLHEPPARERLAALQERVREGRAARALVPAAEDWTAWWAAVGESSELAGLVEERGARPIEHVETDVTFADHLDLLGRAGFAEAGTVWQCGDDRVIAAVR